MTCLLIPIARLARNSGLVKLLTIAIVGLCALACTSCSNFAALESEGLGGDPENVSMPPPSPLEKEDHSDLDRVFTLMGDGKYVQAEARLNEMIANAPNQADFHCYKGEICAIHHRVEEAIAEYSRAIELNPRFEIAYNDRATQYMYQHEDKKAIADYSRAMLLGPGRPIHWTNRAHLYLASKQYFKAMTDASSAINKHCAFADPYYIRAQAWLGLKNPEAALIDMQAAQRLAKETVSSLEARASIYFELCQPESCAADCTKIIALNPKNPDAYYWRGRCDLIAYNYAQARSDFNTYKKLVPNDDVADTWLKDIEDLEYDLAHKPNSIARQWAIACSAQMFTKNSNGVFSLGGMIPTERRIQKEKDLLVQWWGIDSRESLLSQLESLKDHGFNELWLDYAKSERRRGAGQESKLPVEVVLNLPRMQWRCKVVDEYAPTFGDRGILAWDLVRYICLCRWGYLVGYLDEEEAYRMMMPVAARLQTTYGSWKQMGEEYLIGRKFWNEDEWKQGEDRYIELTKLLVNCKSSPWVYLPWKTKLQ
jgi:tetratricopeptide (TPR) repeat protein